jgi:hypothetical protein
MRAILFPLLFALPDKHLTPKTVTGSCIPQILSNEKRRKARKREISLLFTASFFKAELLPLYIV